MYSKKEGNPPPFLELDIMEYGVLFRRKNSSNFCTSPNLKERNQSETNIF